MSSYQRRGKIKHPKWDNEYQKLKYTRQPIKPSEIEMWRDQGYTHDTFSGVMYGGKKPMPTWVHEVCNEIGFKKPGFVLYCMDTMEVMPVHLDHFETYCEVFDVPKDKVYRALVMLEEWKPGHYLEIDGEGIINWEEGEYYIWGSDVPHAAANIGRDKRWTLQITGLIEDLDNDASEEDAEPEESDAVKSGKQVIEHASLLTHNLPDRAGTIQLQHHEKFGFIIRDLGLNSDTKTTIMSYAANTHIHPLHDWELSAGDVKRMNVHGVHIYLYEPLCSYYTDDPAAFFCDFNAGFYSEFPGEMTDWERMRAAELDSISHFIHSNGLTDVTVHTGDYDVEKYYPQYTDHMKLVCNDLFLRTLTQFDHLDTTPKDNITNKFISTNWRFTPARCIIGSLLAKRDTNLVWYFDTPSDTMDQCSWFNWKKCQEVSPTLFKDIFFGLDVLNKRAPHYLDFPAPAAVLVEQPMAHFYPITVEEHKDCTNPVTSNPMRLPLMDYYRQSFVDIVNESRYAQPTANLSEKTYQAIQHMTPFVLVAPVHTLKYLKELGFKTFGKWWDESYDDEPDPIKRIEKVYNVIKSIDEKTIEELRVINDEMKDILEFNFKHMVSTSPDGELREYDKIIWDEVKEIQWAATISLTENGAEDDDE